MRFSPLLALTLLSLVGFGQSCPAQAPEKLPAPKEVATEPPKKEAAPDPKVGMEEPKKEEPKPWEAGIAEAKKATDDLKNGDVKAGVADAKGRGDTAWMLASSALVMLMVPGLALFYGGMVRKKNVLATMMQSYAALAVVGLYWVAVGYGLAFGPSQIKLDLLGVKDGGIVGWSSDLFFLWNINSDTLLAGTTISVFTHVMFQGMFAIITPALISGALAERIRFWPFCIFMILWVTFVYCPLAHMVWAFDWFSTAPVDPMKDLGSSAIGLLGKLGALDFAGGTVVHIAAGTAGLAAALVLRRRVGYPGHTIQPNSMVLTLIGAGLLWFGWFGFNGGSAGNGTPLAASAFAATQAAAAAAGLSWILVEWLMKGKPTALGLASGIVAGLVAVTPASGFVYIWGGAAIGFLAGIICYFSVALKSVFKYDDSLDAFGVHAVGGFFGAIATGVFCYAAVNSAGADGFFAIKGQNSKLVELRAKFPDMAAMDNVADLEAKVKDGEAKLKDGETDLEKAKATKIKKDEEAADVALTAVKAELKKTQDDLKKAQNELKKSEATQKIEKMEGQVKDKEPGVAKAKTDMADVTTIYDLAADAARRTTDKAKPDALALANVKFQDALKAYEKKKVLAIPVVKAAIPIAEAALKEAEEMKPKLMGEELAELGKTIEAKKTDVEAAKADLEAAKADQEATTKYVASVFETLGKKGEDIAKKAFDSLKEEKEKKEDAYKKVASELNGINADLKKLKDDKAELKKYEENRSKLWAGEKGPMTQFWIQVKAALFSTIFAFSISLLLALLTQVLTVGNFTTAKQKESEGLDLTEHGEVGFDLSIGYDSIPTHSGAEPKAAKLPPGQKRFDVVVEGIDNGGLIKAWSELCLPTDGPVDPDFRAVYPYVTTVQGNRFRLRGGDPTKLSVHIQKLFSKKLGKQLKVRVEE